MVSLDAGGDACAPSTEVSDYFHSFCSSGDFVSVKELSPVGREDLNEPLTAVSGISLFERKLFLNLFDKTKGVISRDERNMFIRTHVAQQREQLIGIGETISLE